MNEIYVAYYTDCYHEGMWPIGFFKSKLGAYKAARKKAYSAWMHQSDLSARFGGRKGYKPLSLAKWEVQVSQLQD